MQGIKEGYTRVSQILDVIRKFDHIDKGVLENKARIGTSVHEKICAEVEGIFIEEEEAAKGYVQSWQNWYELNKEDLKYLHTEKRLYCDELKITGSIDAVVEVGDYTFILDYKTSATCDRKTKKIWALQAAFYHYLACKNGIFVDPTVEFVHLQKDGSIPKLIDIFCIEDLWEDALRAYHLYHYLNS